MRKETRMKTFCDHCEQETDMPVYLSRETQYAYWCKKCCEIDRHLLTAIGCDDAGHWEESYPRVRAIPKRSKQ